MIIRIYSYCIIPIKNVSFFLKIEEVSVSNKLHIHFLDSHLVILTSKISCDHVHECQACQDHQPRCLLVGDRRIRDLRVTYQAIVHEHYHVECHRYIRPCLNINIWGGGHKTNQYLT